MTSASVPEDVIYEVVKAVFENFDSFQRLHPAFENLDKETMLKDGLSAPFTRSSQILQRSRVDEIVNLLRSFAREKGGARGLLNESCIPESNALTTAQNVQSFS